MTAMRTPFPTLHTLAALALLAFPPACDDDDDSKGFSGVATVERSDTLLALHYYSATLLPNDPDKLDGLDDGDRVYFSGSARLNMVLDDDEERWDIDVKSVTGDITEPLVTLSSASAEQQQLFGSREGFREANIHITRDYQRNDWLNATAFYPTSEGGKGDLFALTRNEADDEGDEQVYWLRLRRARPDTAELVTRQISVPINCIRDPAAERIKILLKRYNQYGEIVESHMVYSYINFMEQ